MMDPSGNSLEVEELLDEVNNFVLRNMVVSGDQKLLLFMKASFDMAI